MIFKNGNFFLNAIAKWKWGVQESGRWALEDCDASQRLLKRTKSQPNDWKFQLQSVRDVRRNEAWCKLDGRKFRNDWD